MYAMWNVKFSKKLSLIIPSNNISHSKDLVRAIVTIRFVEFCKEEEKKKTKMGNENF